MTTEGLIIKDKGDATCQTLNIPPVRKSCIINYRLHKCTHEHTPSSQAVQPGQLRELTPFCYCMGLIPGTSLGPSPAREQEQLQSHRAAVYPLWWVQLG